MEVEIKKEYKTPSGVYVLFGEEDYLKRFYAAKIREALLGDSPYALFNHVIFTPKSFTADAAADALMTPPVFDEKKLIELSEYNFAELKAAEADALLEFFEAAKAYDTVVVLMNLAAGALDYGQARGAKITKPSALYKKLNAAAKMAYLPHATARELIVWAGKHFAKDRLSADERTLARLIDVAGSDMSALAGEIEKLCVWLHANGRDTLTAADIDRVTCQTKELEPFALSGAVLDGDADRALSILRTMEEKRVRPFSAFAGIYSTYIDLYRVRACLDAGMPLGEIAKKLKMHEYRTKLYAAAAKKTTSTRLGTILTLCREADLAVKSESTDYGRLRALICEAAR